MKKSLYKIGCHKNHTTVFWFLVEEETLNKRMIKEFHAFIDYLNVLTMNLYYTYFKLFIVSCYFFNF